MHVSIVAAARANGLPYGKTIFITAGPKVPPALQGYRDDCFLIPSPGGGQTAEPWHQCCKCWASIAEGEEIFVVDGHGSHLDLLATEEMCAKGVEVCTLLPNVSDIDQVSRAPSDLAAQ